MGTGGPVMTYLVQVRRWSGQTNYDSINDPTWTIYIVINGHSKHKWSEAKIVAKCCYLLTQEGLLSTLMKIHCHMFESSLHLQA